MAIDLGAAKAAIRAAMDSYFGPIPTNLTGPQQAAINTERDNLSFVIATACTYTRDNAVVIPGTMAVIPSDMSNSAGALTGDGTVHNGTGTLE